VLIEFDPKQVSYSQLLDVFWNEHSPTHSRKGQYRSAVFTFDDAQSAVAEASRSALAKRLNQEVLTEISPAQTFWLAEDYHQQYFDKTGLNICAAR
jgi:peptide-methionine (S)-S-oxide reductase